MDADSDELIIKRKSWRERWCSHGCKLDFISAFKKWLVHNGKFVQMVLADSWASFSDCYVQRVSTQMGLLKLIEVNKVFNVWGVCPKWNSWLLWIRNEHFRCWFNKFLYCVDRADPDMKLDRINYLAERVLWKSWRCYVYSDEFSTVISIIERF